MLCPGVHTVLRLPYAHILSGLITTTRQGADCLTTPTPACATVPDPEACATLPDPAACATLPDPEAQMQLVRAWTD